MTSSKDSATVTLVLSVANSRYAYIEDIRTPSFALCIDTSTAIALLKSGYVAYL